MVTIYTTPSGIRQAMKEFRRDYPHHAQLYAVELKHARRLVKQQRVYRGEGVEFFVGGIRRANVYRVAERLCACGRNVCEHRLAVNLAVIAEGYSENAQHVAANEATLEAHEVQELLTESEGVR